MINYCVGLFVDENCYDIVWFKSKQPEFSNLWFQDLEKRIKKGGQFISYSCYNYISVLVPYCLDNMRIIGGGK